MRCAFAQRFRPFERSQRGLAVFTEDDLAGFINGYCIAIFVKGKHAFGAQDDVVGCFGESTSFQCGTAYRVAQDFALELGSEGLSFLGTLADGLQLLVVVTAKALSAAVEDLVDLALGQQLRFFVLASTTEQAFHRINVDAFKLSFELRQLAGGFLQLAQQFRVLGFQTRNGCFNGSRDSGLDCRIFQVDFVFFCHVDAPLGYVSPALQAIKNRPEAAE